MEKEFSERVGKRHEKGLLEIQDVYETKVQVLREIRYITIWNWEHLYFEGMESIRKSGPCLNRY